MSDINSGLPVRSQLPGQVNYDDIIVKVGDATNPDTQQMAIDASGRVSVKLFDGGGTAITSQANGAQQALDVGINVAGVQIDPRQIRALTNADVVTAEQGTSPWVISGTVAATQSGVWSVGLTEDHNYGTVGANTLRTASQLGNATGAADFNYGAVGAQTLRVASQIGNATGSANFGAGATGAQTLRVESNQGAPGSAANGWFVKITDGTNTQTVTAGGEALVRATNFPNTVDTNYGAVGANTIRTASQIGNATGAADFNNGATGAQTLRVAANLAVGGANVSATNPVPVTISSAPLGTSVNNYNTASAIAAGATSNHDYVITATKTFQGKKIWASASGLMKIEVQVSPDGLVFSTLWVGFNSTATPNISIDLEEIVFLDSGVGSKIRVIRTNMDKKPMDVYSTISGTEVP